jgi:prephenate dehydratase
VKIGFQGIQGAYSEMALMRHFGRGARSVGFSSFEEVFDAVTAGMIDAGFVPVENSIAGTVVENYDLLLTNDVFVTAEAYMAIRHTLLGIPGAALENIALASSHPHALNQCKEFLKVHGIRPRPTYDTAGAARILAENPRPDLAAIASELCADIYRLDILCRDIQSKKTNITRFFVVVKESAASRTARAEKTSIAFITRHYPGALVDCLSIFRDHRLNLTKLESRPVPENPWEYVFYTDFEGGVEDEAVGRSLDALKSQALFVKILGSYPKGDSD